MKDIVLNNGRKIPVMGYGTWQTEPEQAVSAVEFAIRAGFTHIDTAAVYGNEREVGEGIRKSGADRSGLFVTTKVWNTERGYDKTRRALETSLSKLGMDYVDLYLIHWPANPFQADDWKKINSETWRAMEDAVADGQVRTIGLSNFMPRHIKPLLDTARILPAVNQIECHPGWKQQDCIDFCRENEIAVEAWSPLAGGSVFSVPLLAELSAKYSRSVAQIVLQWVYASGIIPLTKSVTPSRIEENIRSLEFSLSDEDMARIDALAPCGGKCRNPDLITY